MRTVLVVDDEPEITTLLRFILEKDGHAVSEAPDGAAALRLLGVDPLNASVKLPDLIILDIKMPIVDGYTVNMKLQADPRTRAIPILVLTSKKQKLRDLFEMAPNVAAYVQKPFDVKALRKLVEGILSGRKT